MYWSKHMHSYRELFHLFVYFWGIIYYYTSLFSLSEILPLTSALRLFLILLLSTCHASCLCSAKEVCTILWCNIHPKLLPSGVDLLFDISFIFAQHQ